MDPKLKLPFLVLNLLLGRRASVPPTPPPNPDEKKRYDANESTREVSWFLKYFVPLRTDLSTLFDTIEIYLILSQAFPAVLRIPYLDSSSLLSGSYSSRLYLSQTFVIGSVLLYTGAIIRIICYHVLGRHFTYHMSILKDHSLITTGPYSIVRHPSYTGKVFLSLGIGLAHVSEGSWLREYVMRYGGVGGKVGVVVYLAALALLAGKLIGRVPVEDNVLKEQFGEKWEEWARGTPYKLIPGVY